MMMRRMQFAVLAITAVVLVVVPAAQAQRRGGFGRDPLLGLLQIEKVQIELDLLDVQIDEGDAIAEEMQKQFPLPGINFQEATDKEREAYMKKMAEINVKRGKVVKAKLAEMLAPDQYERLMQIHIQQAGSAALQDAYVAKKIKLTAAQQKKIKDISDAMSQSMRKLFVPGADFAKLRPKMTKMRADAEKQTMAVLTAPQKKQFTAMHGKKFELPRRGGGGRGRGKKKGN
jgi:Spy/CpxP family protein refolding chaperone